MLMPSHGDRSAPVIKRPRLQTAALSGTFLFAVWALYVSPVQAQGAAAADAGQPAQSVSPAQSLAPGASEGSSASNAGTTANAGNGAVVRHNAGHAESSAAPEHVGPSHDTSTHRLLALQRDGVLASPVPRPLEGEIAQRSRIRYLKSFEREIPERFQSSIAQKSGTQ